MGSRPTFSKTCGLNGSINTSTLFNRDFSKEMQAGIFRSVEMDGLYEVRISELAALPGRSNRITEAP